MSAKGLAATGLALAVLGGCSPAPTPVEPVAELQTSELSGPGPWTHEIEIEAGTGPILLRLEQQEADLRLEAAAGERRWGPVDNGLRRVEDEILLLEAAGADVADTVTSRVTVTVTATGDRAPSFGYRLLAERLPLANAADEARVAAHRRLSEVGALLATGDQADREAADALLGKTRQKYGSELAPRDRARLRLVHGRLQYSWFFRWEAADALAAQAAADYEEAEAPALAAHALSVQAMAAMEQSDRDRAEALILEARHRHRALGQAYAATYMINNLGLLRFYQERWADAGERFGEAGQRFQAMGETAKARQARGNAAMAAFYQGAHREAAPELLAVAEAFLAEGERRMGALYLNNAAWAYAERGELDAARGLYRRAREQFQAEGETAGRLRAMQGIAFTYLQAGAESEARTLLSRVHAEAGEHTETDMELTSLALLGKLERRAGRTDEALVLHRRLLARAESAREQARARMEIGLDHKAAGDMTAAVAELEQAASLMADRAGDALRARVRVALGRVLVEHDAGRALPVLEAALADARTSLDIATEIRALQALAAARAARGETLQALARSREALQALGELRSRLAGPHLRWSFAGVERPGYSEHIRLLMELAEAASGDERDEFLWQSLAAADAARSRTLSELMAGAGEPGAAAAQAQRRLAGLAFQAERKREAGEAVDPELRRALQEARLDLDTAWEAADRPQIAEGIRPEAVTGLLSSADGTPVTLVAFHLAEPRSLAWVVRGESIRVHSLAGRAEIEPLAADLHDALSRRHLGRARPGDEPSDQLIRRLSETLVTPLLAEAPAGVLVVVADGALELLPFEVLKLPDDERVLERFEVVYAPALAVLERLRERPAPPRDVAWIGVPPPAPDDADATAPADPRLAGLPPLSGAGRELATIRTVAEAAGLRTEILAPDADLGARLRSGGAPAVLHLATHGLLAPQDPRLSGLVVAGPDGPRVLGLGDILSLPAAELVTLSACDTAGGGVMEGEGVFSLAHGFLAGGARRVLASRWQLDDGAVRPLMERFYTGLFGGERPSRALQQARLALLREGDADDSRPYHWAGLALHGDWRRGQGDRFATTPTATVTRVTTVP